MIRIGLYMPASLVERAKEFSKKNGVKYSQVIREGLELRLEMPEFKESIESKIESYKRSITDLQAKYNRIVEALKDNKNEDMFKQKE